MTPGHRTTDAGLGTRAEGSRWTVGMIVSFLVLAFSYLIAVWTRGGQALENAALRGADQVGAADIATANRALDRISVYSLAVAVAVVVLIAILRRRLELAVAGVGLIALGQVITQVLKRWVLPRPSLVEVSGNYAHNSFPSGHTAIAMTVLFALLVIVPYRWRGWTVLILLAWAVSIGAYTITAKWHRLSDTVGADAIAVLCACLASWWLARRGSIRQQAGRARPGRVVLAVIVGVASAVTLLMGAVLWIVAVAQGATSGRVDATVDFNAYLGANLLAGGFSGLAALIFWGLWRRLGT